MKMDQKYKKRINNLQDRPLDLNGQERQDFFLESNRNRL